MHGRLAALLNPRVETATSLNDSLAKLEKGPKFHMEEAAAPSRPTGLNVLVLRLDSAEIGDPFTCSFGCRGRRAKR
eukprot:12340513-Alexandrium_andersonii.AAC.1